MALDANRLGAALKAAYDKAGVEPGEEITDAVLLQIQVDVAAAIIAEITANAQVTSSGATLPGPPGGPLTITGLGGVIT